MSFLCFCVMLECFFKPYGVVTLNKIIADVEVHINKNPVDISHRVLVDIIVWLNVLFFAVSMLLKVVG